MNFHNALKYIFVRVIIPDQFGSSTKLFGYIGTNL